jgi:Zn-finger nucleic acid-binding protein
MTRWGISPNKNRPAGYEIDGCSICGGIWLDARTLKAMVAEAADLANKVTVKESQVSRRVVAEMSGPVRYRRCPVCKDMMARQNFERVSGIILDTCPEHGTYFDTGELQDVLNFVRSGGLVLAQQKKAKTEAQLSAQEAAVRQPPAHGTAMTGQVKSMMLFNAAEPQSMLTRGVGEVTIAVIRWSASWAVRLTKMALLARRRD